MVIDNFIDFYKENCANHKQNKGSIDINLEYNLRMGEFIYRYSYIEELIRVFFENSYPECKNDSRIVKQESTKNLLKYSIRRCGIDVTDIFYEFTELNNRRRTFSHGCWGVDPRGGYVLSKILNSKQKDPYHFSSMKDLDNLNEQCRKWVIKFKAITNIGNLPEDDGKNFYEYLVWVGRFVFQFSQLEFTIKVCVAEMYEITDDYFSLCDESFTLHLLELLSIKLEGATFEKMKKDFRKLNAIKNDLFHKGFKLPINTQSLEGKFSEAEKLTQKFARTMMWVLNNPQIKH